MSAPALAARQTWLSICRLFISRSVLTVSAHPAAMPRSGNAFHADASTIAAEHTHAGLAAGTALAHSRRGEDWEGGRAE